MHTISLTGDQLNCLIALILSNIPNTLLWRRTPENYPALVELYKRDPKKTKQPLDTAKTFRLPDPAYKDLCDNVRTGYLKAVAIANSRIPEMHHGIAPSSQAILTKYAEYDHQAALIFELAKILDVAHPMPAMDATPPHLATSSIFGTRPRNRAPTSLPILHIEIEHWDAKKQERMITVTDPNSITLDMLGRTNPLLPLPATKSLLSHHPALLYRCDDLQIALTYEELRRLVLLMLLPSEFATLANHFGIAHEWHDDFYDEEGFALQPKRPNEYLKLLKDATPTGHPTTKH